MATLSSSSINSTDRILPMFRAAEGVALFICNTFAGTLILCSMRRRSAFILVASMILADGLFGLAQCLAGFRSVRLIDAGKVSQMVPRSDCGLLPSNLILLYLMPMIGLLPLAVAIDRLLCVFTPIRYYKYSFAYSYVLIGMSLVFTLAISTQFLARGLADGELVQIGCTLTVFLVPFPLGRKVVSGCRVGFTFASILLYIPIIVQMRKASKKQTRTKPNFITAAQMFTRRLTQSAILNALNTLILFNIPDILLFLTFNTVYDSPTVITVISMMLMSRGFVSTAIFLGFHRQLRQAVWKTIKCQKQSNESKQLTMILPAYRSSIKELAPAN